MIRKAWLLALAIALTYAAAAETVFPPNAALKYWQAAALLPQDFGERQNLVYDRPWAPETASFVRDMQPILALIREGTAIQACDWGLRSKPDADQPLPHLGRLRQLNRLVIIAAQYEVTQKHYTFGMDYIFDSLTMARHAGSTPLLVSSLVDTAMTGAAVETLAVCLQSIVPRDLLAAMSQRAAALPPRATVADAVRKGEKPLASDFRARLAAATPEERAKLLASATPAEGGNRDALQALLKDAAALEKAQVELEGLYDKLADIMSRSGKAAERGVREVSEQLKNASPLAREVIPPCCRTWFASTKTQTTFLMLLAAAEVVCAGDDPKAVEKALAKHPDPFGDGPFTYRKLGKGFQILSAFRGAENAKPLVLSIGVPQRIMEDEPVMPPGPGPEKTGNF
ncbi:MAG TPA: hypothetical protein VGP72_33070 [Planctomycetota bacterium]|jgi:hypothetical protein